MNRRAIRVDQTQLRRFIIGLDLGQAQDPSALTVIERTLKPSGERDEAGNPKYRAYYDVLDLERFPLGTPYSSVSRENVEDEVRTKCIQVLQLYAKESQRGLRYEQISEDDRRNVLGLVVDASGVGRAVVEHLRDKLRGIVSPTSVYLTGGNLETNNHSSWNVPKTLLVGVVHNVLGDERIKVAEGIGEGETLKREMTEFRVKVTKAANEIYEANEGAHDDTVIATALPLWRGERMSKDPLCYPEPLSLREEISIALGWDAPRRNGR